MIKVNNKIVKGLSIAYDTCHKIYICEDETDVENAKKWGYDLYPINKLQELYDNSCELKFISNWKLTEYYVKQFENAIFEEV